MYKLRHISFYFGRVKVYKLILTHGTCLICLFSNFPLIEKFIQTKFRTQYICGGCSLVGEEPMTSSNVVFVIIVQVSKLYSL